jgi:pimeloyl-ACP methyl ester carboxylesterase
MLLKTLGRSIAIATFMLLGATAHADTIVLVHGAFQDGKAWAAVTPLLEKMGHKVIAVTLPGRNDNPADPGAVSLDVYRDAVIKAMGDGTEKVDLVGHSFGGFTISEVAEAKPDRIATAVYVAAYLPKDGESMQALSGQDKWNKFTQENFVLAKDYSTASVLERDRALIFCNECDDAHKATLLGGMVDEPLKPVAEAIKLSDAAFGTVRKAYIATKQDNAVSRKLQQMMIDRTKVASVIEIDTGHAPAISNPQALADAIIASIAAK